MNLLQGSLLGLAIVGAVLAIVSRRIAKNYAQLTALLLVAAIILMPFAWLVCAAFKDKSVLNEYTFLPPAAKISSETINLDNFRTLFEPQATPQGPVTFWRFICNSVFLASAGTMLSMFFSSMGGYALAKYRFRGRNATLTLM